MPLASKSPSQPHDAAPECRAFPKCILIAYYIHVLSAKFIRSYVLYDASSGVAAACALLLAFATSASVVFGLGLSSRLIVFAVVVAMQVSRRAPTGSRSSSRWLIALVVLPLLAIACALLGQVMRESEAAGDALVVAALTASFAVRNAPAPVARVGALLSLPVVTLFVTPIPGGGHGAPDIGWYVALSLLAGICAFGADRLLAHAAADWALRSAVARFTARARRGRAPLRQAATDLDRRIAAHTAEAVAPLRRALLEAELAATVAPAALEPALERLDTRARTTPVGASGAEAGDEAPERISRLRPRPPTRLAVHSGLALALALVITQRLYPDHWSWAAVSVLAISGGLRSRGDVLLRGGERLLGALGGTLVATLAAVAVGASYVLAVGVILLLVVTGTLLRRSAYVLYAFCVTSALALLYGVYGERWRPAPAGAPDRKRDRSRVPHRAQLLPAADSERERRPSPAGRSAVRAQRAPRLPHRPRGEGDRDREADRYGRIVELTRLLDRRRGALEDALRPVEWHGRALRLLGHKDRAIAVLAASAAASSDAARALVYAALAPPPGPDHRALAELRRQVGSLRRELAGSSAQRPPAGAS